MNYSRVTLLLALALISQTANAWIVDSRPVASSSTAISIPPLSIEAVLRMDPFARVNWPGERYESHTCLYVAASTNSPYFYDGKEQLRQAYSLLSGGTDSEKASINQRLARHFRRNVSLLTIVDVGTVFDFAAHCWRQSAALCYDFGRKTEKVGQSMGTSIDDFFGTMGNPCPVENRQLVDGGLSRFAVIEYLYPGLWQGDDGAKAWFFASRNVDNNGTRDR